MTASYQRTQLDLALTEAMGPTWVYQRDGYFTFHLHRERSGHNGANITDRWYEVTQSDEDSEVWDLFYCEAEAYSTQHEPETRSTKHEYVTSDTEVRELFEKALVAQGVAP